MAGLDLGLVWRRGGGGGGGRGGEKRYIQRQVQTNDVAHPQQFLKPHIPRPAGHFRAQLAAVMIHDRHAKRLGLLLHVPPDAAHAHDPQHFALGVMAQRRRRVAPPGPQAQVLQRRVEVAQRAQEEEDGGVGGGGVDGGGDVRDADRGRGAGGDVDLVVAGAWGEGAMSVIAPGKVGEKRKSGGRWGDRSTRYKKKEKHGHTHRYGR